MQSSAKPIPSLKKILISIDGSENGSRALDAAIQLAKAFSAELLVVSVAPRILPTVYSPIGVAGPVLDYSAYYEALERDTKKIVEDGVQRAKQQSINVRGEALKTVSSVAEAIISEGEKEKVDLIVVSTRGLGGFKKLVLGSVSSALVAHAACSVMVVR
jgi:nucleotide-binding universal stress UspA family protein